MYEKKLDLRLTAKMFNQLKLLTQRCNMQKDLDQQPATLTISDIAREIIKQKFDPEPEDEEPNISRQLAGFEGWNNETKVEAEILEMTDYENRSLLVRKLQIYESLEKKAKLIGEQKIEYERIKVEAGKDIEDFDREMEKVRKNEKQGVYRGRRRR